MGLTLVKTVKSPKGLSGKFAQGTYRGKIFLTIPKEFSLFVKLRASKTKEYATQSCPMSGETVGSTCSSLTMLNTDLGG